MQLIRVEGVGMSYSWVRRPGEGLRLRMISWRLREIEAVFW